MDESKIGLFGENITECNACLKYPASILIVRFIAKRSQIREVKKIGMCNYRVHCFKCSTKGILYKGAFNIIIFVQKNKATCSLIKYGLFDFLPSKHAHN